MPSLPESPPPPRSALAHGLVEVELPAGSVAVADLHLAASDPADVEPFVAFCGHLAGAPRLLVLGDLFDVWVGPAHLGLPGARRVVAALEQLARSGCAVEVLHGNRDFLLDAAFERATGARLHPHGLLGRVAPGGERILFLHGDELCTRDRAYQRLRRVVRAGWVRGLAARLPLPLALLAAGRLRRTTARALAQKPSAAKSMQASAVRLLAEHRGARTLVCGHAHSARDEALAGGPRWVVLDAFGGPRDAFRIDPTGTGLLTSTAGTAAPSPPAAGPATIPAMAQAAREEVASRRIVAIDGPASSGKSSVGRRVAERLGLAFLDTGLLYRAAAWAVARSGAPPEDGEACARAVGELALEFDAKGRLHVDGRVADLRSDAVERIVSQVSAHPQVRRELLPLQRSLAERLGGLVAVGRDVTTVVFPHTPHKFYLDAGLEVRARRRLLERRAAGEPVDEEAIRAGIRARDERDSTRPDAPLVRHPEARVIHSDELSLEDVVDRIVAAVEAR